MNDPISKVNLRLPTQVMELAKQEAAATGLSLNAYIGQAIRNYLPYSQRQRKALGPPPSRESPRARAMDEPREGEQPDRRQQVAWNRVGRNDPCPCGSGRKAKHCHPDAC